MERYSHSFRYKNVLYALVSLGLAVLTALLFLLMFRGVYQVVTPKINDQFIGEAANRIISNKNISNNLTSNFTAAESNLSSESYTKTTVTINQEVFLLILTLAVLLGILSFVLYFSLFTRKFSLYLKEISSGIKEFSTGNFNTSIPLREDDELTDIANSLNRMASDIKEIMEEERSVENKKNELITNVAHDLRTPLTSIIGYLDLVSNKELSSEVREKYIGIAHSKSKRLESLIDDLFTYTKFEFGQVALHLSQVDVVKMMEQLLDEFYPSFCEHNLTYDMKSSTKSILVEADGDLLARAFANLVSNAIKYGRHGKNIIISMDTTQTQVIISIINYGEIILKKDIDKIFEKFYRVDRSRNEDSGGSGLGLAIAKNIICMHNGSIQVKSSLEGTVFEVVLNLDV